MDNSLLYLTTPSTTLINLPVLSKKENLPIEELSWEDFERLCLRMVQINHSINDCEIYGVKGQKQDGIDIFARVGIDKYESYQCKRYKSVTEKTLAKVVAEFKNNNKYDKSTAFYFCTTFSINKKQLQDKFNELKDELEKDKIKFVKWDKVQISRILKDEPQIVYDFFGREWVKAFNGEEKLLSINPKRKLDGNQVIKFRKELYHFYSTVFNDYDFGLPMSTSRKISTPIQDRFIMPEAYEETLEQSFFIQEEKREEVKNNEKYLLDSLLPEFEQKRFFHKQERNKAANQELPFKKHRNRALADTILENNNKSIVIGDPGGGKSTLLRNLVLDILAEKPKHLNLSNWKKQLPIWLPFPFITKNLLDNNNLSIQELIRIWFKSLENEALFDIIKYALDDERLILVVDGIDELSNISSAQKAISLIEIHAKLKNAKIIYSSRPYGYKLLSNSFQDINEVHLLPFSDPQQKQFVNYWYQQWFKSLKHIDKNYLNLSVTNFFNELNKSAELKQLAGNPLLLSVLVSQKLRDASLPNSKVKAIEAITKHLIEIHPKHREKAASIITEDNDKFDFELIDIFEELAIYIQESVPNGLVERSNAQKVFVNYLKKWFDFPLPKARKISKEILAIGAKDYGIIIEKTANEIAFSHRLFQEFLAARYLLNSEENDKELLKLYGGFPTWHQVIKFYFGLLPHKQPKRFSHRLKLLGTENSNTEYQNSLTFLKYDIALTSNNVPISLSKKYFEKITEAFEYETDEGTKKIYWKIILEALHNPKIKKEAQSFLFGYFPNRYSYSDYRVTALTNIPKELLTFEQKKFLVTTLINGNIHQRLDASNTIRHFIQDEWIYNKIIYLLDNAINLNILPFIINSIITNDVSKEVQLYYFNKFKELKYPQIALFILKLKVFLNLQEKDDYKKVIALEEHISYQIDEELTKLLISGWKGNLDLMNWCLKSLKTDRRAKAKHSWKVLMSCFNNEQKVIDMIQEEIKTKEYPFIGFDSMRDGWQYLAAYFKGNKQLIPVIDEWIEKQEHRELEVSFASKIGLTEKSKLYLMKHLPTSGISHWYSGALYFGYGGNEEVIQYLKDYFKSNNSNKIMSAHLIADIFEDEKEIGIKILEEIIFSRATFIDRAVIALIRLDKEYFRKNILEKFLFKELKNISEDIFSSKQGSLYTIIDSFKDEPLIKNYVINTFLENFENISFIINLYPNLTEIIHKNLEVSKPLGIEYRLELVKKLGDYSILSDQEILSKIEQFEEEEEDQVRSEIVLKFNQYLFYKNNHNKIIEISKKKIFAVGFNYEIQRQLAFCGYLITKQLHKYFSIKNTQREETAHPDFSLDTFMARETESITLFVIEHFEYLNSVIGNDFKLLTKFSQLNPQKYWSFWAEYSKKNSPTSSYILDFITKNQETIEEIGLLSFLDRTDPQNEILKKICLRLINDKNRRKSKFAAIILGKNFSHDEKVFQVVSNIKNIGKEQVKLLALCIGWENTPLLKEVYEDFENAISNNTKYYNLERQVAYQLLFTYRDVNRIMRSFDTIFHRYNYLKIQKEYKEFINPLKKRLNKDELLQQRIKKILLESQSTTEKISFYAILKYLNKLDDDIINWRQNELKKQDFSFGYNIISNELEHISYTLTNVEYFN